MLDRTSSTTQDPAPKIPGTQPRKPRHPAWGRKTDPVIVRRVLDDAGNEAIEINEPDAWDSTVARKLYRPDDVYGWALRLAACLQLSPMDLIWARLRDSQEAISREPEEDVREELQALVLDSGRFRSAPDEDEDEGFDEEVG